MKTLVAYHSISGNTKFVAEEIAHKLDADLCEVVDKKYKKGRFLYLTGGYGAFRQKLSEIEVSKSVENYGLIIVGSPVWAGKITPAIRTFLKENNLSKKQVAFFVTLGGTNFEKPLRNIKETVELKPFVEGLAISGALDNQQETKNKVKEWCSQLIIQ